MTATFQDLAQGVANHLGGVPLFLPDEPGESDVYVAEVEDAGPPGDHPIRVFRLRTDTNRVLRVEVHDEGEQL